MKCYQMIFDENSIMNEEMKSLLNTLCGMQTDKLVDTSFTIGIVNDLGRLKFYCITNDNFHTVFKQKINTIYPSLEFEPFDIQYFENKVKIDAKYCKMKLVYEEPKKLQTQNQEKTFMNNLLNALYYKDNKYVNIIEMSFKPKPIYEIPKQIFDNKTTIATKIISKGLLKGTSFLLDCILYNNDKKPTKTEKLKIIKEEKEINFNYSVSIKIGVYGKGTSDSEHIVKLRSIAGVFSQLNYSNILTSQEISHNDMFNRNDYNMQLNSNEISQFLYLPTKTIIDNIVGKYATKIVFDRNVPSEGIVIGVTMEDKLIAIPAPSGIITLKNHSQMYLDNPNEIEDICKTRLIMGLPGTGKSEWIVNYCIQCLKKGIPFIVIDPKYDTQRRLIESLPDEWLKNVDFLDLGDLIYPTALNIFRRRKDNDATENGLITTGFISYMKKQFGKSWGFNIERMVQMTTDTILLDDISTMTEFYWMLKEQLYRETMIDVIKAKLDDPDVENKSRLRQLLAYWTDFEERYKKNPMTSSKEVEPVMNKIGTFIGNRFINAIVSQRESYDFKNSGDTGRSVIINIPEGIVSRDNMALLSGFINKAIWTDYQSRDDMEIKDRYPVEWIIDEASTIIDDDFIGIMNKARSRRLGLNLAIQRFRDVDTGGTSMSGAIIDNCKSKIIFRIGHQDAMTLADEFTPLNAKDLSDCMNHHFYGRVLLPNGTVSKAFYANSLPMAKKLRNYDEYKDKHRSGKMKIGEIEDQIENRLDAIRVANALMK